MSNSLVAVVSEFQRSSSVQGEAFEQAAEFVLRGAGWDILGRNQRFDGYPEIDRVATDPNGVLWWIEAKGSWQNSPGLERGDTVKKAVAVAYDLMTIRREWSQDGQNPIPYMLITSHPPKPGTVPDHMLRRALACGAFNQVRILEMPIWIPHEP